MGAAIPAHKFTAGDDKSRLSRIGELRLSPNAAKLLDELQEAWTPAQFKALQRELREMPERLRKAYLEAVSGQSLRQAAKVVCMNCSKMNRGRVRRCTERCCPLHPYRPYQRSD